MRIRENWAFILLGIYLVLEGLIRLIGGSLEGVILGLLALAAGILLLLAYVNVNTRTRNRK